jgi:predicted nucleic acid-binding protein
MAHQKDEASLCRYALLGSEYHVQRSLAYPGTARSSDTWGYTLVTTEEVLVEFLSAYAGRGEYLRRVAMQTVRGILDNAHVTVIPQTHQSFMAGLSLYARRADKAYSLVDCISMHTMGQLGITEVLTNDHHFSQEGFIILILR